MAGEPQTAECPLARALRMPVSIECDHGYDVCPICDPCTCGRCGVILPAGVGLNLGIGWRG